MSRLSTVPASDLTLPKGIQANIALPDPALAALWDSIILDRAFKERLLAQAVLNFTLRRNVSRTVIPLHGVILLVGQPGTGKSSLARGLASKTASVFSGRQFSLLEVEPHALTSSAMGKTQRAVTELFSQAIAESTERGPTVVLLDEVETLAADRAKMSLDANPIDVHRATDAVLVQLDNLAQRFPDLLFLATSNFPQAVDQAFMSRCDYVAEVPLPNEDACNAIIAHSLNGLGQSYSNIAKLASRANLKACATAALGLDGRAIRKAVCAALASSLDTASNPNLLTVDALRGALQQAHGVRSIGGRRS